jgi:hypothetical protein
MGEGRHRTKAANVFFAFFYSPPSKALENLVEEKKKTCDALAAMFAS